jgi:phenylacetate-CoA ligase
MLDNFRSRFGYKLGLKTAWFSGKNILSSKDLKRNRFWKTDNYYNVRYFSTFHLKEEFIGIYAENLRKYKPEFLIGFPSSMLEIARFGLKNNIPPPENIKAIFPTAESITHETRTVLESFFKAKVYDQYASSEGAPFIYECKNQNLHLELQSGVFEVLDENDNYANIGRLVITSFTTSGTPLIRYDIGDSIELSDGICDCGNHNPLVKEILGREDDFIFSPQNGKINLGNISNTLKDTQGIKKFQVIQNEINTILLKISIDEKLYNKKIEKILIKNWRDRIGSEMNIKIELVYKIEVERSGKYRIVKNHIKHLL